jgi:hypothetical protein
MAERSEIEKLMATMALAFPGAKITDGTPALYARMLGDLPSDELATAVMHLIATCEFFPSIAAIRKAVTDARTPAPLAELEWRKVTDKASGRICDPWGPFTQAAVDAVGWDRIRLDEHQGFLRRDFVEAYKGIVERAKAHGAVAGLEIRPRSRMGRPASPAEAMAAVMHAATKPEPDGAA